MCFAVADGVGQRPGGDVAAQIAIDTLWAFANYAERPDLVGVMEIANRAIREVAASDTSFRNAATTMTAVQVASSESGPVARVAHVGDSRFYVIRNGRVMQMTDDHVVDQTSPKIRPSDPSLRLPSSGVPVRALGMSARIEVAVQCIALESGDRLLLCTDGVTDRLSGEDLGRIASQSAKPHDMANRLVWSALSAGSRGDATALVVDIDLSGIKPSGTRSTPVASVGQQVAA
jgi:PPM family protein phosphatase